jgi:NAD/NADP octopine/nopaline dehydrogenase, alpha-helical domain
VGAAGAFDAVDTAGRGGWLFGAREHRPSITICGTGNGAHAMAVVASQNFDGDIDWLAGSEERARALRRGVSEVGLRSSGAIAGTADRIRTISAEPAEVIPGAGMVLILVPAFAHAAMLRRIAPHLSDETVVGCIPARGGFEFDATGVSVGPAGTHRMIFGLQTLPWSTRVTKLGQSVHVGAVKREVLLAALPTIRPAAIAPRLAAILGIRVIPTDSFLGLTLGNPGQFIHPALMYGHFRTWGGEEYDDGTIPLLYAEATDEMGELVDRLSDEALAVTYQLEARSGGILNLRGGVLPIHAWLRKVYGHLSDTTTTATSFRTGPIKARKAPMLEARPGKFVPNFGYRYLTEDVPFGLVATHALAEIAGVETPAIDEVISWAQSVLNRDYLADGKLQGADVGELRVPQNHGVSTLADLIDWYSELGAAVGVSRLPASAMLG